MAGELAIASTTSGLVVDADLYLSGNFVSTVRLTGSAGAPGTTIYKADMPGGTARGTYSVLYRVEGREGLQGPDIIKWTGTEELNSLVIQDLLTLIQSSLDDMQGTGFFTDTDSLEALSNAIAAIPGDGGGGGGGIFNTDDRATLSRIEAIATDAQAGAIGDFIIDQALGTGTLLNEDGSQAAVFQLRDIDSQPSIEQAVQRIRVE